MRKNRRRIMTLGALLLLLAWAAYAGHRLNARAAIVRGLVAVGAEFDPATARRWDWLTAQKWLTAAGQNWIGSAFAQPTSVTFAEDPEPATIRAFFAERWPALEELTVARPLDDVLPAAPLRAPRLKKLAVFATEFDPTRLAAGGPLPSVESISIQEAESLVPFAHPAAFPNVREIKLQALAALSSLWPTLARFPALESLELSLESPPGQGELVLPDRLQRLAFRCGDLDASLFEGLSKHRQLKELVLDGPKLDRAALARHGLPRSLEALHFSAINAEEEAPAGFPPLGDLSNLRSFRLCAHLHKILADIWAPGAVLDRQNAMDRPTGDRILVIGERRKLDRTEPDCDAAGPILRRMEKLETIHLWHGHYGPRFFTALAGHPSLVEMNIVHATLDEGALAALEKTPALQRIYLAGCFTTPDLLRRAHDILHRRGGMLHCSAIDDSAERPSERPADRQ